MPAHTTGPVYFRHVLEFRQLVSLRCSVVGESARPCQMLNTLHMCDMALPLEEGHTVSPIHHQNSPTCLIYLYMYTNIYYCGVILSAQLPS